MRVNNIKDFTILKNNPPDVKVYRQITNNIVLQLTPILVVVKRVKLFKKTVNNNTTVNILYRNQAVRKAVAVVVDSSHIKFSTYPKLNKKSNKNMYLNKATKDENE